MREALRALEFVVVIDVAMTESAREAHYVLPASSQYEKWEATFFGAPFHTETEYANTFTLRAPILDDIDAPGLVTHEHDRPVADRRAPEIAVVRNLGGKAYVGPDAPAEDTPSKDPSRAAGPKLIHSWAEADATAVARSRNFSVRLSSRYP